MLLVGSRVAPVPGTADANSFRLAARVVSQRVEAARIAGLAVMGVVVGVVVKQVRGEQRASIAADEGEGQTEIIILHVRGE